MKTRKIMEMNDMNNHYICILDTTAKRNPYKIYRKWYDDGWHRKKVNEYGDFQSVLWYILQTVYRVPC